MNKAVFFDRDGVINNNSVNYYTYKYSDFILIDGIIETFNYFFEKNFMLFVVSNQGGISKDIYNKNDVIKLHNQFNKYLKEKHNIKIEEFAFCPHHSDFEKCLCRKPNSLLIEKLMAKYNISIEKSFFIGDSERDILAAKKIELKAFKVEANIDIYQQLSNFGLIDSN